MSYTLTLITKRKIVAEKENASERDVQNVKDNMMGDKEALCYVSGCNVYGDYEEEDVEFCFKPRDIDCFYSKPNGR